VTLACIMRAFTVCRKYSAVIIHDVLVVQFSCTILRKVVIEKRQTN